MVRQPDYEDRRLHLAELQKAAFIAADPDAAIRRNLSISGLNLRVGDRSVDLRKGGRLLAISIGKAGPAMARAAAASLEGFVTEGLVTQPQHVGFAKRDETLRLPPQWEQVPTEHPYPGKGSLKAGQRMASMLSETDFNDVVLVFISGGGSAMIELPEAGVTLEALKLTNQLLLASGAPIGEINRVRACLSLIKGGGLARLASPAQTIALIFSDVVGDRLSSVASGPTVLRRTSLPEARRILKAYDIFHKVPGSIRAALEATDRPHTRSRRPINVLVANNRLVVEAVAVRVSQIGFLPKIVSRSMRGEAGEAGRRLAVRLRNADPGDALVSGGETTVTVRGRGLGGRNQELALSAALRLQGTDRFALMALATDGVDGPTDAAGALVDDASVERARRLGLDPETALLHNDSYPLLEAIGGLVKTGPSGTNLNDIVLGLRYR